MVSRLAASGTWMPGRVLARADQAPEAPHGGSRRVSMPLMRGRALFPWSVRPRGRPRLTTRVTGSAPGAASRGDRAQADGATRGPAAEWPAVPPGPVAPRAGGEVAAAGVARPGSAGRGLARGYGGAGRKAPSPRLSQTTVYDTSSGAWRARAEAIGSSRPRHQRGRGSPS